MEQRTVSDAETLSHLEELLRDFEKDQGLRIEDAAEKAGTNPGDNYMSYVVRTKVNGTRGNGHPYKNNIITKRFPADRLNTDVTRARQFFTNEAHVYTKIVPRIGLGFLTPRCLEANADNLIMEDLCLDGYVMCERKDLLDLEHCEATVKGLARLHAHSLAFKLKNPEEFKALLDPLKEVGFPQDDNPAMGQTINSGINSAIRNLESIDNPDENIREAMKLLKSHGNRAYDIMRDLVLRRDEKYHVMTHGDSWNNNIFFKHDANGRITNLKFVDFQAVRHSSPAIDFHYFVYTSARSSVIEESYDDLVKIYQTALVREMKNCHAIETVIRDLSLEWFKEELRKTSMYGLLTGLWIINAILAGSDDIPDVNNITNDYLAGRTRYEQPIRDNKVERTKCIVLHYCRTYPNST